MILSIVSIDVKLSLFSFLYCFVFAVLLILSFVIMSSDNESTVTAVVVKLPAFWSDNPATKFFQAEAQLAIKGITVGKKRNISVLLLVCRQRLPVFWKLSLKLSPMIL